MISNITVVMLVNANNTEILLYFVMQNDKFLRERLLMSKSHSILSMVFGNIFFVFLQIVVQSIKSLGQNLSPGKQPPYAEAEISAGSSSCHKRNISYLLTDISVIQFFQRLGLTGPFSFFSLNIYFVTSPLNAVVFRLLKS